MEGNALGIVLYEQEAVDGVGDKINATLDEILAGCKKNNASSQEKLYKSFYGYALSIAMKYCYKREEAMEAVNDSFLKFFNSIGQYNPKYQFKPWFRRIVINSAIDQFRSNKKHAFQADIAEAIPLECPVNVVSDLDAEQVLELLNHLPPIHRFVFNMYEVDGYSHQEIAASLDIPEGSSRTYLMRAKAKLRLLYKKYYVD